jgi:hypothetical protein
MSEFMIRAHGGGDVTRTQRGGAVATGMLVSDTMAGADRPVHMKQLDFLVSNTTGVPLESTVMDGVLTNTLQDVPTGHMATSGVMPSHLKFATSYAAPVHGQVPYAEGKGQTKKGSAKAAKAPKKEGLMKTGTKKASTKKGDMRKTARRAYEDTDE